MAHAIQGRTSLLIIDDDERILRMLRRNLSERFDDLATVETNKEAEMYLMCHPVTHLISDLDLGPGEPDGFEIVTRLRRRHPQIQRAVVFTGASPSRNAVPQEVDGLVEKSGNLAELIEALALFKA